MSSSTISIQKVYENSESQSFVKDFAIWQVKDFASLVSDRAVTPDSSINPRRQSLASIADILVSPAPEVSAVPEGGDVKMWRIENFKLTPIPEKKYGNFYSGDSYMIQYKVPSDRSEEHMIYFWLGSHSTSDDKAAAAVQAKELDEKLGGTTTQVKVVEGREPIHFRGLFKGTMVVHRRGKVSGYKEKSSNWKASIQCAALYQVEYVQ